MRRKLIVKGHSEDIAVLKACYRMFFPEWEVEEFPEWLKDMEESVCSRMTSPSGTRQSSSHPKVQTGFGTLPGSC